MPRRVSAAKADSINQRRLIPAFLHHVLLVNFRQFSIILNERSARPALRTLSLRSIRLDAPIAGPIQRVIQDPVLASAMLDTPVQVQINVRPAQSIHLIINLVSHVSSVR